jgi:hypothetical protein
MSVAFDTSWATLVLASNVCGSVFGLSRIDDTDTYLPPICWSTLAYSFSAPTARMTPELAGAEDPDEEQAARPRPEATRMIAAATSPDDLCLQGFRTSRVDVT